MRNARHLKRQYGEKILEFTMHYFFTSPSKLYTNINFFILSKHGRIPFNERASWYRQNLYSIIYTSRAGWVDRRSRKGGEELWKCSEVSIRTSPLRGYWADKEALKFWYWKKIGKMGKMEFLYNKYVDMITCFFLGFLEGMYASE